MVHAAALLQEQKEIPQMAWLPARLKQKRYSPLALKGIRMSMQKASQSESLFDELVWIRHHFSRHLSSFGGNCLGRLFCSQFPEPLGILHNKHGPEHGQDSALFRAELEMLMWPRPASDEVFTDNLRRAIDDEAARQWASKSLHSHRACQARPKVSSVQAFEQLGSIRRPASALRFLVDTCFHENAPAPASNPGPRLALDVLPLEIWELIAAEIAAVEPYGFQGMSVVAPAISKLQLLSRDFAGLAQACWEESAKAASCLIEKAGFDGSFSSWQQTSSAAFNNLASRLNVKFREWHPETKSPKPVIGELDLNSLASNAADLVRHDTITPRVAKSLFLLRILNVACQHLLHWNVCYACQIS